VSLLCAACATTGGNESEPPLIDAQTPIPGDAPTAVAQKAVIEEKASPRKRRKNLPWSSPSPSNPEALPEMIVSSKSATATRSSTNLVAEAQALLRDGRAQARLHRQGQATRPSRGRPVAFALWSDANKEWSVAHIELPRPPSSGSPAASPEVPHADAGYPGAACGGDGCRALDVFLFSKDGDPLKVYGRKFPVFDNALLKKKQWAAVVETAKPIVYLPFTERHLRSELRQRRAEFLLATARRGLDELRAAKVPSTAFPGELLADAVPRSSSPRSQSSSRRMIWTTSRSRQVHSTRS